MTGPIIPADQWPEHAKAIVWDSDGQSLELSLFGSDWGLVYTQPRIEMPAGHDWQVPVMRQQSPAIDLEQYAVAIQYAINGMREAGGITNTKVAGKLESLLALIDGQGIPSDDAQRLEWLMQNISGTELRRLNVRTDANCDRAAIDNAMQPSKGEGVDGD